MFVDKFYRLLAVELKDKIHYKTFLKYYIIMWWKEGASITIFIAKSNAAEKSYLVAYLQALKKCEIFYNFEEFHIFQPGVASDVLLLRVSVQYLHPIISQLIKIHIKSIIIF